MMEHGVSFCGKLESGSAVVNGWGCRFGGIVAVLLVEGGHLGDALGSGWFEG